MASVGGQPVTVSERCRSSSKMSVGQSSSDFSCSCASRAQDHSVTDSSLVEQGVNQRERKATEAAHQHGRGDKPEYVAHKHQCRRAACTQNSTDCSRLSSMLMLKNRWNKVSGSGPFKLNVAAAEDGDKRKTRNNAEI